MDSPPSFFGVARGAELDSASVLMENAALGMTTVSLDGGVAPLQDLADEGIIEDPGASLGPTFDPSGSLVYTIQKGDNLSKIATRFKVSAGDIMSANPTLYKKTLKVGTTITIPNGVNAMLVATTNAGLPNYNQSFVLPTQGFNYGILHNYNAIDIANSCGTPVVAAAEGLVIPDENIPDVLDGWNGGYGDFILVEHPFGTGIRTRYAHLEKLLVQPGDYVKQGQEIGLMGQTGDATGCHLHFEVIGAQNPFVK
jgi:murein DD-endopeptidase MepM/ murein hydrolase activator NlpD